MLINGLWLLCEDGVVRPAFRGEALRKDGSRVEVPFLADTGADRTVLNAATLALLGLEKAESPVQLGGVGGATETVAVTTEVMLPQQGGGEAVFKGQFVAFTDPDALQMSVLGRDLTNYFALIIDRPGDVVCLLGQRHRYRIETA